MRDSQRRFVGWLVIIHDISNRRRTEAERYAFERRVQEQQKSESLMVLAGGVAHDFNNLLTGILGNADLIAIMSPPDSEQRRAAETIVIGAQRAADLVSKMLAYSGGGRVVAEQVELDALVRGDGGFAGRVGGAPLHADLQESRTVAARGDRPDADPADHPQPDRQRR